MPRILAGKPIIDALKEDGLKRVAVLKDRGVDPVLAIVRIGARPDDLSYERTAIKRAEALGIGVRLFQLDENAGQDALMKAIGEINADQGIHGCLMFRPLPAGYDEEAACEALDPRKDVDGIGRAALAHVFTGRGEGFAPCTAAACLEMLDGYGMAIEGKHAVVVGRSLVIGRPVAMMLLERNATVTVCHSRTENLPAVVKAADIVVLATGRARAYDKTYFSPGQIVLDVGINMDEDGNLCGDADFDSAEGVLGDEGAITPVPRGIGGVTTSVLMKHVIEAAQRCEC
ncbi:bifunctional 5,10-methylenetetrahydrofolate dehydrogenase/5,10-methenyltetrahydrofolate cyclohydrolase [Slackia piriformis]|uniref:bifunctional 5,10-methylenetetrahydrofolate dehydrogenase/5,10-methenyltetrahydrofolate cyclohydrolase n=1 Tax=Slackia piriformis TaxID=626934 RepID=UPI0026DDC1DE|nr:bifunctional 5,10-methylenetetrahydrofolate dehydrogenase/5,10-methenyltetrahydrofolate cyclohydrolase [Slackia piriformis]MDO5023293.1 bifunctional 5,10-methylenetetrahydrofolate dehydrogenase/5,10-methenyltetrahydrofolate cyclohydrolase [Slackia piriformis]